MGMRGNMYAMLYGDNNNAENEKKVDMAKEKNVMETGKIGLNSAIDQNKDQKLKSIKIEKQDSKMSSTSSPLVDFLNDRNNKIDQGLNLQTQESNEVIRQRSRSKE